MTDWKTLVQDCLADMAEATRLTRAGRLEEATAMLQRRLSPTVLPAKDLSTLVPDRVRDLVTRGLSPLLKRFVSESQREASSLGRGEFIDAAFGSSAGSREYKLYVPANVSEGSPLVVMLHGCGQSPDDFAVGTGMNAIAESEGFLVAYPAQTVRAHGQRCWNWYQPQEQTRGSGEAAIIAGITTQVIEDHGIDPRRVYICGLSAGGAAAANIAKAYPDVFAAVGVHSGLPTGCASDVTSALTAMRLGPLALNSCDLTPGALRLPTIVFHGENDNTVHPSNGDQILVQAGAHSLRATVEPDVSEGGLSYLRTCYADAEGAIRIESWSVRGLGHAWSGGDPLGSHTDPRGPDASRALVNFFLSHRLDH